MKLNYPPPNRSRPRTDEYEIKMFLGGCVPLNDLAVKVARCRAISTPDIQ
jgi:hypothetical protein